MFRSLAATTLFVQNLEKCAAFYRDTIGLQVVDSNADSAGFSIGDVYFLLLEVSAAARMISEEELKLKIEGGPRTFLAALVDDVDAVYETLKARGVKFLRLPADQPWGRRTAYFADPEGNIWEINQIIEEKSEE